jgi:hypothetical protein
VNSYELHCRGLVDDRGALMAALIEDGWPTERAEDLVNRHATAVLEPTGRPKNHWQRWTQEEWAAIDEALEAWGWKIPGVAVTRPLAEKLGRGHKSLLSAMDRRIAGRRIGPLIDDRSSHATDD